MIRRRLVRFAYVGPLLAALSLVALSAFWTVPAGAAQVQNHVTLKTWGWWQESNFVNGENAPASENPTQMHVQVGPIVCGTDPTCVQTQTNYTGPTEVSAVRYLLSNPLPFGTDPNTPVANLKLDVTMASGGAPSGGWPVMACASGNAGSWQGGTDNQGGNWTQRATAPTSGGCSAGVLSQDGKSYQFALLARQMQFDGATLDIVITPPPNNPQGTNPTLFQVEFDTPTNANMTLYPAPDFIPQPSIPQAPAVQGIGVTEPPPPSAFSGAPQPVNQPGPATATGGQQTAPLPTVPAAAAPQQLNGGKILLLGGLLLLLLVGLLALGLDLSQYAPLGEAGGVGRFARPRAAPPIPI